MKQLENVKAKFANNYYYRQVLVYKFLFVTILLGLFACIYFTAKANDAGINPTEFSDKDSVSKNQPKVDIKINKEYDTKGNIIAYDSVYTYSYSSNGKNLNTDSIFNQFKDNFNQNGMAFFDHSQIFNSLDHADDMFLQIDSIHNKLMEQFFLNQKNIHHGQSILKKPGNKIPGTSKNLLKNDSSDIKGTIL